MEPPNDDFLMIAAGCRMPVSTVSFGLLRFRVVKSPSLHSGGVNKSISVPFSYKRVDAEAKRIRANSSLASEESGVLPAARRFMNREIAGPADNALKPAVFRNAQCMFLTFICLRLGLDCPYAWPRFLWEQAPSEQRLSS
jgi:hypothetical protein